MKYTLADLELAVDVLWPLLIDWIHNPEMSTKPALMRGYASLPSRSKLALADDVQHAVDAWHGPGPIESIVAYRRMKPNDAKRDWGAVSLTTRAPTYPLPNLVQALIAVDDIMVHHAQRRLPLGGVAFGHEQEVILKPGARPLEVAPYRVGP